MRRPKGLECRKLANGQKRYRINTSIKGCKVKGRFTSLFLAAIELQTAKEGIDKYLSEGNPRDNFKVLVEVQELRPKRRAL